MYKTVKNEYYSDWSAVPFCHACLSTDRTLLVLTEYVDIFNKICNDQNMVRPTVTQLCWECMALLKKVKMFSKKVSEAQRILQYCLLNNQNAFPHSLTCLKTSQVNTTVIALEHKEVEVKQIKIEVDVDENSDTFNYTNDDIKDEDEEKAVSPKLEPAEFTGTKNDETNSESKTLSNKKKKEFALKLIQKRQSQYRYVNTNLRKHRSYLIKTVPVDESEVLPALEVERSNAEFLKAEHKCVNCVEQFSDDTGLMKHFKTHHDESLGSFVCGVCSSRFPTSACLLAHSSKHNFKRRCRVCGIQSMAAAVMAKHVRKHHRIIQCIECGMFFDRVRHFYGHYRALHRFYICDVCGKSCKSRDLIERHLKYHFGYPCPHCKKVFKTSSSRSYHIDCQHTETVSEDTYCVPCDLRFKNVALYKRHLQTGAAHAKERVYDRYKNKYPCPECGKEYSRKTYMNNHFRHVHTKQSKYKCEDCDQQFLNRTKYLYHRRFKHEGAQREKDKQCNICGRGFAEKTTLINHIRTHSGERPFACEYCGAKFTQRYAMQSHVKFIHLKNKRKPSWHE